MAMLKVATQVNSLHLRIKFSWKSKKLPSNSFTKSPTKKNREYEK